MLCMILLCQGNFSYVYNGYDLVDLVDQGSILGSTKFFKPCSFSLLIFGLLLKAIHMPISDLELIITCFLMLRDLSLSTGPTRCVLF